MNDDDPPPALPGEFGQKPHEPTEELRQQVQALASFGVPQEDIALYIEVDPKTLRKHYRRELDIGLIHANAQVAQRLFKSATVDGNVASIIFWLKSRAGWRESAPTGTGDATAIAPTTITIERHNARIVEQSAG